MGFAGAIADAVGAPEAGVKLLLIVYSGYIMAMIHRQFPYKHYLNLQYAFFTLSSLSLMYWSYGLNVYHSILCVFVQWMVFQLLGASYVAVSVSFLFQLTYLIMGYYLFDSQTDYAISWTMPHCCLTLKMIGLAFDVYDGHQKEEKLNADQKERGIKGFPSILEIFGFAYFYPGFIVGPQFPLSRFRSLFNGELTDVPGSKPNSVVAGFRRGLSGTIMLGIQTYLAATFSPQFYTTKAFQSSGFFYKYSYVAITGHVTLLQYISIWIINEGSCILCGLGYTKDKETGKVRWDTLRNVTLHNFLLACSFQDLIEAFNINTNGWVLRYVFKRLRFVGIRAVSQGATLLFLAIWHGVHIGYFTCFAYEFLTMSVEKPLIATLSGSAFVARLRANPALWWIPKAVGFIYLHSLLGYCLIDFSLLKWNRYLPVYQSIYFSGHVFYGSLWVILKVYKYTSRRKPEGKSI